VGQTIVSKFTVPVVAESSSFEHLLSGEINVCHVPDEDLP
jgi:hypothetical protein